MGLRTEWLEAREKPRWPLCLDGPQHSKRSRQRWSTIGENALHRPTLLHLSLRGEMLSAMLRRSAPPLAFIVLVVAVLAPAACERRGGCTGANCGTLIDAAVAEPSTLLPP